VPSIPDDERDDHAGGQIERASLAQYLFNNCFLGESTQFVCDFEQQDHRKVGD